MVLRVFYASSATPNAWDLPHSRLWDANLYQSLVEMGCEVVRGQQDYSPFNEFFGLDAPAARARVAELRQRFSQATLDQVAAAHRQRKVDLFFSYFYSAYIEPAAIRAIRDLGIVTVNWYCNASYQFDLVQEIAPAYDWCLVPEKFRLDDYRRVGARPLYCQEAANPSVYKPSEAPQEFDVTFVGQRYGNRPRMLRALIDAGLDAHAWGPRWQAEEGWRPRLRRWALRVPRRALGRPETDDVSLPRRRLGPPLDDAELVRMFSRSRINLGFTSVNQPIGAGGPLKQVRLRDFEVPMSGGFYLVERFDELADFFEPGREIVFFEDASDLVDKARYYLAHPQQRERIRQAGLERARRDHTWRRRFESVFRQMGLA